MNIYKSSRGVSGCAGTWCPSRPDLESVFFFQPGSSSWTKVVALSWPHGFLLLFQYNLEVSKATCPKTQSDERDEPVPRRCKTIKQINNAMVKKVARWSNISPLGYSSPSPTPSWSAILVRFQQFSSKCLHGDASGMLKVVTVYLKKLQVQVQTTTAITKTTLKAPRS